MKKRILTLLICALIICVPLSSCSKDEAVNEDASTSSVEVQTSETTEAQTTEAPAPENSLLLFDGENFLYKVIRPEGAGNIAVSASVDLRAELLKLTGVSKIEISDDFLKKDETASKTEIVVGKTNRPLTKTLTDKMDAYAGFEISVGEDGIAICGTSETYTGKGVEYFIETYLPQNIIKVGEKMYIKCGSYSSEKEMPSFGQYVKYCLDNKKDPVFKGELYMTMPPVKTHNILQGGCIDKEGKYVYFLFQKNNQSSIAKYDFETKKIVDSKHVIDTDHSNDACYNSKLNAVIVVHNAPNYKLISMFDADTLERKGDPFTFSDNIYSIAYNEKTDRYVVGLSGDYNFAILDSEFKIIKRITGAKTGYTRQGVDADDEYIYFVQSTGTLQYIVIYTWEGTHIATLPLYGIYEEVEHAFHIGNQLYISCYPGGGRGGENYKINITIQ